MGYQLYRANLKNEELGILTRQPFGKTTYIDTVNLVLKYHLLSTHQAQKVGRCVSQRGVGEGGGPLFLDQKFSPTTGQFFRETSFQKFSKFLK